MVLEQLECLNKFEEFEINVNTLKLQLYRLYTAMYSQNLKES